MDYIVNPRVFYWIGTADGIKTASIMFLFFSMIASVVAWVSYFVGGDDYDDKEAKMWKTLRIVALIVFSIFLVATIFVPSKTTLIEMTVAKYATRDNAEWTIDAVKSVVDYVVEAVKSVG